jgi:hypothetical protein
VPSTGVFSNVVQGAVSLTVSGEGYWEKYDYENGRPESVMDVAVREGWPNGHYRYEFVAVQDVPVAADAPPESAVFVEAGGRKQPAQIESGSFTMNNGTPIFN